MTWQTLTIALILLLTKGVSTMAQISNKVCDTIPYEFVHNKIIIPVTVNGMQVKYIVDTGGITGTMWETAVKMKATAAGYTRVSDVNTQSSGYQEAYITNFSIGKGYKVPKLKTMVLPANPFFTGLGVVGILGGDAFAQSVITFDSRSQIMVINYPYRPERLKVTDGVPLLDQDKQRCNVNIQMGDATQEVLFDTGADGFLLYSTHDYQQSGAAAHAKTVTHGFGIVSAGINGLGKPVDLYKVVVPSLRFLGKEFTNVGCTTTVMNGTIIGVDMLKYGKVIVDYMRKRFYFLPFDKGPTDMGGAPSLWNVSVLPLNKRFEITTVWDSMKDQVKIGDVVTHINVISLKDCEMSQMAVEAIMNAIPGDTSYILVNRDGKEVKIEIKKEKQPIKK